MSLKIEIEILRERQLYKIMEAGPNLLPGRKRSWGMQSKEPRRVKNLAGPTSTVEYIVSRTRDFLTVPAAAASSVTQHGDPPIGYCARKTFCS